MSRSIQRSRTNQIQDRQVRLPACAAPFIDAFPLGPRHPVGRASEVDAVGAPRPSIRHHYQNLFPVHAPTRASSCPTVGSGCRVAAGRRKGDGSRLARPPCAIRSDRPRYVSDRSVPGVGAPSISRGGRQGIGHQSYFPGGLLTGAQLVGYLKPVTRWILRLAMARCTASCEGSRAERRGD